VLKQLSTVLVLAIALPGAACAQGQGQRAQASCPAERVRPDLGIGGIECHECEVRSTRDATGPLITFLTPPTIDGVRRGGVADGVLRHGDVLLAIDGVSIVGRAGGYAFDAIRPHVPVRLTVRRNGGRRDVVLTPGLHCSEPYEDDDEEDDDDGDEDEEDGDEGEDGEEEEDPR
jgi:hypothetical protein